VDEGRALLGLLAGCHDLGKASPAFQVQVEWLADRVAAAGFSLEGANVERQRAPHALVSAAALVHLLRDRYDWSSEAARRVATIVGGHHGRFPEEGFTKEPEKRPKLHGCRERAVRGWRPEPGPVQPVVAKRAS
jgi:CRISPR-associated endonuclease Cas3-HD